jgi:radical SAM protein with 4Fe4S-binding SPASM domain
MPTDSLTTSELDADMMALILGMPVVLPMPRYVTPPKITISITNKCNLECRWCYGDCGKPTEEPELSCREWFKFIDYLLANDFIAAYIEGGEPFHRPDFLKILKYSSRRLMTLVRTNGTLIDEKLAKELKAIGVGRIFVDIMGATAATHDELTGVEGSFQKSCAAVEHLTAAGIKTDVLVILNRKTFREIQGCVDLAHRLGALRLGILRLYPLGRAKRAWFELALSLEEQTAAIANLRVPDSFQVMKSWHPNDRNCCWQGATVNAFGDSIGCTYLREYVNFGNIRVTPFLDTWNNNELYRTLREGAVEKSCPSCSEKDGTRGGCRSTAFAFHGRWDAPDPFCTRLNEGTDLRVLPKHLL